MASGRPDYWYGMLPGYAVSGTNQSDWSEIGSVEIAPGDYSGAIDYTVPAKNRLHIITGIVSAAQPGINQAIIMATVGADYIVFFDTTYNFPNMQGGVFVLEAGERFQIALKNNDNINVVFNVVVMGFLEYKVI